MPVGLSSLLAQADALRFKLLAIYGKNDVKKNSIINKLKEDGWTLIDVESELLELRKKLDQEGIETDIELGREIKEWFNSKPNKIILINANILYHELFTKISPIGAFKYNSRNKNCVLFLEDEKKLGSRLYHGEIGKSDFYDQEISDILIVNIDDIDENIIEIEDIDKVMEEISGGKTIKSFFQFQEIKDVVDIDTDISEEDKRRELVNSFIVSEALEPQISDFFDDLVKATHKGRKIIGNYGSGKSHLVGFLVSLVEHPQLADFVNNETIKQKVKQLNRKFFTVQFELGAAQVPLRRWFYSKVRRQLWDKYKIELPIFDEEKDFDDKENIIKIIEIVKKHEPTAGLLVAIDEISDFLAMKQKEQMRADYQFLRIIGQVCQDQDFMFIGSMQEDIFSSHKFKDIADQSSRIEERFVNIIIHKENIKKVIAERIVPKDNGQKIELESELAPFAQKIEDVSRNIDDYINLYPLTPFIIELFSDLPYFEKRGVIQFAMNEIKKNLHRSFPYFITFDKIFDLLDTNPNKRNLEEINELHKAMEILKQKIKLLNPNRQTDALKIVKGLAVYALWNKREQGATAQELANNLMLLPSNKHFSAADYIALIIKEIRNVTDGEYIKFKKDKDSGITFFYFDTKAGIDPEQKITQKAATVSEDELEHELFIQLKDMLELEHYNDHPDVFEDECNWKSVKSYRMGYVVFVKKNYKFIPLPKCDYVIAFVSPFVANFKETLSKNQMNIKLHLEHEENIELLKEIIAIKQLININFQKHIMIKKLEKRINGDSSTTPPQTGFRYRLSKLLLNFAECSLNEKTISIKKVVEREKGSILEIVEELKTILFDSVFNETYPLHPSYPLQLSSRNIQQTLSTVANDLIKGDFTSLSRSTKLFLRSLDMLDSQEFPDLSHSQIAQVILDIIKKKPNQVTDIEKEIVYPLQHSDYGLEKEVVHLILILMTVLGKIYLQAKGGDRIDINNIREKLKSLAAFETIAYARLQESHSYDFAARLLNALGLNGSKITLEKERLVAFKEYKEKINTILQDIQKIEERIGNLAQRPKIFLDMDAIRNLFARIQEIDWDKLNINNHAQFSGIETFFNEQIPKITIALNEMNNLFAAIRDYEEFIHDALLYMEDALKLLADNKLLVMDEQKLKILQDFYNEIKLICDNFDTFLDRGQRNPIRGKIQQFKKIYIYDFYLPAHEKYVGNKVNWQVLDTFLQNETFKKLALLKQLQCINGTVFDQMIIRWNELKQYRCLNPNLEENLQNSVRCPRCSFPVQQGTYATIPASLERIEDEIEDLFQSYEKTVLNEIRAYRDNIQYLDSQQEKQLVEAILNEQKLPSLITQQMVQTINKLFKEIDVVEIDRETLISTLFPNQEMIKLEQLHQNFVSLIENIKKNRKEDEIRIKLK